MCDKVNHPIKEGGIILSSKTIVVANIFLMLVIPSNIILYVCMLVDDIMLVVILIRLLSCYTTISLVVGTSSDTMLGIFESLI